MMNVKQKAHNRAVEIHGNAPTEGKVHFRVGYEEGYNQCLADIKEFIRANPKSTNQQITDYLNSL